MGSQLISLLILSDTGSTIPITTSSIPRGAGSGTAAQIVVAQRVEEAAAQVVAILGVGGVDMAAQIVTIHTGGRDSIQSSLLKAQIQELSVSDQLSVLVFLRPHYDRKVHAYEILEPLEHSKNERRCGGCSGGGSRSNVITERERINNYHVLEIYNYACV